MKQAAKWRVPANMINTIPGRTSADTNKTVTPSSPSSLSIPSPGGRKNSSSSITSKGSKNAESSGVIKDVALKIIPKKKVKGNEAAVWGEMEVLKGLNHDNIVRTARTLVQASPLTRSSGQVLPMVRIEDQVLSLLRTCNRRRTLRANQHAREVHRGRCGFCLAVSKGFQQCHWLCSSAPHPT